jgi:hypothetical protein
MQWELPERSHKLSSVARRSIRKSCSKAVESDSLLHCEMPRRVYGMQRC